VQAVERLPELRRHDLAIRTVRPDRVGVEHADTLPGIYEQILRRAGLGVSEPLALVVLPEVPL
jgi:hypothetical protein